MNHGYQIRIHKGTQGGSVPLLPDFRTQRSHKVSRPRSQSLSNAMRHNRMLDSANDTSNLNRAFLTRTYPTMKKHNPTIPIMLREAQGTLPKVYARYDLGKEKSQSLEGMVKLILAHLSGREVK